MDWTKVRRGTVAAFALSAALLAGCADDEEPAAPQEQPPATDQPALPQEEERVAPSGAADDVLAYCAMAAEFDQAASPPSDAELAELADVAPAEISDQVRTLVDAMVEGGDREDPEVSQAESEIVAWEEENCPEVEVEEPEDE